MLSPSVSPVLAVVAGPVVAPALVALVLLASIPLSASVLVLAARPLVFVSLPETGSSVVPLEAEILEV